MSGRTRSALAAVVVALVVTGLLVAQMPAVADAKVDASCKKSAAAMDHTFKSYVLKEGVGLVAWRAHLAATARDRCDHGGLTVTYSWGNESLASKSGKLLVTSVRYQTTASRRWRVDGLVKGSCAHDDVHGCFEVHQAPHIDLSRKIRITKVQIKTALSFEDVTADAQGAPYIAAPRTWTCDVRWRDCTTPPNLPRKLPGTYHCNFSLGRTLGIIPTPPNGLYDLRLRSDGSYAFGGSAGYPTGSFDYKSKTKSLTFAGGYLAGVHGTWLPTLRRYGQPFAGSQGVKLSSFAISPGAEKGKHDCLKK